MPKIINKRHTRDDNAKYIGRGSKYGNRFVIGIHGDRDSCIKQYKDDLEQRIKDDPGLLDEIKHDLGGYDLACWCAPLACHGDILMQLANEEEP